MAEVLITTRAEIANVEGRAAAVRRGVRMPEIKLPKHGLRMPKPSSFVYIVDRYLEVSNVYHLRMDSASFTEDASQNEKKRLQKLADLIKEGVEAAKHKKRVSVVRDGGEKGQVVITTAEFLRNTKLRQQDILDRIKKIPDWVPQPPNINRATTLLNLESDEFLGSFPSPSYASDVLSELASWTVCPDVTLLAARDMVHMHAVELQRHLMRLATQSRLVSPSKTKSVVALTLEQLLELERLESIQDRRAFIERAVENSAPRDPAQLFEEVRPLFDGIKSMSDWLAKHHTGVLEILLNENQFYSDPLEHIEDFDKAREVCNSLVVYGLVASYAAWHACASDDPHEMGYFRTNILFCTRILLDEKRWKVCREFAEIALAAMRELNAREEGANKQRGTAMLTANWFFARLKSGEKLSEISDEITRWDVDQLHARYAFLKQVLLCDFDAAGNIALSLLEPSEDTGVPNMCSQEFAEWPILEEFRNSEAGKRVLAVKRGQ